METPRPSLLLAGWFSIVMATMLVLSKVLEELASTMHGMVWAWLGHGLIWAIALRW